MSAGALVLLAAVVLAGTVAVPLSDALVGRKIVVGEAFYNRVLVPIGLVLLATTAAAPLLRWGAPPAPAQRKVLFVSGNLGGIASGAALAGGIGHPLALVVAALAVAAVAALLGALVLDAWRRAGGWGRATGGWGRAKRCPSDAALGLRCAQPPATQPPAAGRRQYAGFLIHLGFVSLALGVAGSALGTRQREASLIQGETVEWAGRSIRYTRLVQRETPGQILMETQLDLLRGGDLEATLLPAQQWHKLQDQWTSRVAIHSTWTRDLYVILHRGETGGQVHLTLFENPMVRWLWLGGYVCGAGALVGLWPARRSSPRPDSQPVPPPAAMGRRRRRLTPSAAKDPSITA